MGASGSPLSSSEPDEKKSRKAETPLLYTYPGYPEGVNPDFLPVIVTNHAKKVFQMARPRGSLDNNKEPTLTGQGLVGIGWLGKNEEDEYVIYLDLIPAFNKDDNLPRENKDGIPYESGEFVYTNEPLGGNSGRNHLQFTRILQRKIQDAYDSDSKNSTIPKMYQEICSVKSGKVRVKKNRLHGFGVMKGGDDVLLDQFRNVSANLNFSSTKWDPEYLLINYFYEKVNDPHQLQYYLRRPLPANLTRKFKEAIVTQLPCKEETVRDCLVNPPINKEELEASVILADPRKKIRGLMEALAKAATSKLSSSDIIFKTILAALKENIKAVFPGDEDEQKRVLARCLNIETKYNKQSIFTTALVYKDLTICRLLREEGGKYPDISDSKVMHFLLENALKDENIRLFKTLLNKGAILPPDLYRFAVQHNQTEFIEAMLNNGKVLPEIKKEMLKLAVEINEYHSILTLDTKPEHTDMESNRFVLVPDIKERKIKLYRLDEKGNMIEKSFPMSVFFKIRNLLPAVNSSSTNEKLMKEVALMLDCPYSIENHDRSNICELILKNSKSSEIEEEFKVQLFERAVISNKPEIVKKFIKNGLEPNKPFRDGRTPLFIAALEGNLPVVNILLSDAKVNINIPNLEDKRTPFMAAIARGHVDVVNRFIEKGVDINLADAKGLTPLMVAIKARKKPLVQLLLKNPKMDTSDHQQILTALEERQKTYPAKFIPALDIPIMNELREAIQQAAAKTREVKPNGPTS